MNFGLSETQELLQQTVRDFVANNLSREAVRTLMASETAQDRQLWNDLNELGLISLTIPETKGGFGMGAVELAAVAEVLGHSCMPGPFLSNLWALSLFTNLDLDTDYLDEWVGGQTIGTVALLETGQQWGPVENWFLAIRTSDGFTLNGKKTLVWDAEGADHLLVLATLDGEPALFHLSGGEPGLTIKATPGIDETRKLYHVELNMVRVTDSAFLAKGASVVQALEVSSRLATIAVCAEMVGCMQWILDTSVSYAGIRNQFDRPIGSFQAVQHMCADMLYWLESARSATYYAAYMVSVDDPSAQRYVSIAKAFVSDVARKAGHAGIQVHGGIGFTWDHDMHLYFKRIIANEICFGDAVYHREQLAALYIDAQRGSH